MIEADFFGGKILNSIETWHEVVRTQDQNLLDNILDKDCVFYSPVVHSPQLGKDLTLLYLSAAAHVFKEGFRYTKEIVVDRHAVLEFECEIDEISVNGVDLISLNDEGLIAEFKVMVRPLKAINILHKKMAEMLQQIS